MQSLYYTAVVFIGILPVIINPYSQYLTHIPIQRLEVMPVLDLLYGRIDGLVIFQLYNKRRLLYGRQRQKYHIRIPMTGGQFPDEPVILSCSLLGMKVSSFSES